jgi:hypothetical protein
MKRQGKPPAVSSQRTLRRRQRQSVGVTFEQVRRVALDLPGVEDGTSYGTPALKVRGRLLARLHQSLDCLVLRADFLDRQILLQSAPGAFFITDHYRNYPWVLMRFSAIRAAELPGILERAWRLVAPSTLVRSHDAAHCG